MAHDDAAQGSEAQRAIGHRLRLELARRGMARKQLVDLTGLSSSTIDKALAGHFSESTRVRIESVLGAPPTGAAAAPTSAAPLALPAEATAPAGAAPIDIGGYTRSAVDHYIGLYLTVRPSFNGNGTIYCYGTEIRWSEPDSCLVFEEFNRPEKHYQHSGKLYIPPSSMFVHLVSLTKGAMRAILVSQLTQRREMRGLITTLANDTGTVFIPVSAPIVYQKRDHLDGQAFGHLTPDDPGHGEFRALLQETVRKSFARWVAAN